MIVENTDAFRTWLTAVLRPICDADPGALAKYVLALIKKDKSPEELRISMIDQLDVFLESETKNFVNLVFHTLDSKDYITTPVIPNANPPNPNVAKPPVKDPAKVIVSPNELPNLNDAVNGGAVKRDLEQRRGDRDGRKNAEPDKDEKVRRRSRHRSLSRNRSRTRSRSWDRSKRSRSREKSRDRDQYKRERGRVWRNKSPPRRYDRRRSRTPSPTRLRSRSRSPRHSHRRYRRGSLSRSRSRTPDKRERRDSAKEGKEHSRPGTPTQDSNHGDMDMRLTTSTQSVASVVVQQGNKRRCRDFDEKGYCMRGEMCLFDHGVDPVVLEDAGLGVLAYDPNGVPATTEGAAVPPPPLLNAGAPRAAMPEYNPQAPHLWGARGGYRGGRGGGGVRPPNPGAFLQGNMQRELISVPVMDNNKPADNQYNYNQGFNNHDNGGNHFNNKRKMFDFNRLGGARSNKYSGNCSLELKKVPVGMNSITHLNNHFGKFGKIVNIQVQYEGDPEAALVTFSSHAEAHVAYRSTEAVLNNRFIKVFWHNSPAGGVGPSAPGSDPNKQENVPPTAVPARNVKERLGAGQGATNPNKVLNPVQPRAEGAPPSETAEVEKDSTSEKETLSKEESKAQAQAAIKRNQELLAAKEKLRKNSENQKKDMMKIKNDLRKKKQELLDKQLLQQKRLIAKMEKLPAGASRDVIKETLKKSQESIEAIKKDLEQCTPATVPFVTKQRTKEEAQRELLDMELDLIAKQQEGQDTTELMKKLQDLRARVSCARGGARGRGRGRYVPVSRHLLSKNNLIDNKSKITKPSLAKQSFQKHTLDHRPTRLLVSGYESEEQESVLAHFQQYGEIVDYVTDSTLPSITLNFKLRKEAEIAMLKGKHFQDRTLSVTWCNSPVGTASRNSLTTNRTVLVSESEEDQLMDSNLLEGDDDVGAHEISEISEEALLHDDEEEDEENEDRSWRR